MGVVVVVAVVRGVQEVLGYSDESYADYQDLKKAQEEINAIINGANEKKRISDNLQSIIKIQSRIEWPAQSLVVHLSIYIYLYLSIFIYIYLFIYLSI
jgi:hypothetical protein